MSSENIVCALEDEVEQFRAEACQGLAATPKALSPKYLYDERGSRLFEEICELPEYYPTRTELSIMKTDRRAMAEAIGSGKILLELGSGASLKTRLLLEVLSEPIAYVPVDISVSALEEAAAELQEEFPDLPIRPCHGDFLHGISPPKDLQAQASGTAVYFPGSTIGNLLPAQAGQLLRRYRTICQDGCFLVGVDLRKEVSVIENAYNDAEGVTAAFNLNLLERMNRELDAGFDLQQFQHTATYDQEHGRIEMHLVSTVQQAVQVAGQSFEFAAGETICTEHSHKYSIKGFSHLAEQAGYDIPQYWTDPAEWFAVFCLTPKR